MSAHALLKWQHKGSGVKHLKTGTRISVRFFSTVLVITMVILVVLGVYDYRAENVIKDLHDQSRDRKWLTTRPSDGARGACATSSSPKV